MNENPTGQIRKVVEVAIVPLVATGADVDTSVEISVSLPERMPRTILELTVAERLLQLDLEHDLTE